MYPNNKISDYCVQLAKPIVLDKPYEVALEELIYPKLVATFGNREVYIDVMEGPGAEAHILKKRIWLDLTSNDSGQSIIQFFNEELHSYAWLLWPSRERKGHLEFIFNVKEGIRQNPLRLHPKLSYLLGYGQHLLFRAIEGSRKVSDNPAPILRESHEMFIYADIVDHQRVGDTMAPLLRICVNDATPETLKSEKYIRPYYIPVCKSRIEEIRIQVRDHSGRLFPFPLGAPLIVKLHFRPS